MKKTFEEIIINQAKRLDELYDKHLKKIRIRGKNENKNKRIRGKEMNGDLVE